MFVNIQIYLIILKTYDQQFTLTTKKSLHIIFNKMDFTWVIQVQSTVAHHLGTRTKPLHTGQHTTLPLFHGRWLKQGEHGTWAVQKMPRNYIPGNQISGAFQTYLITFTLHLYRQHNWFSFSECDPRWVDAGGQRCHRLYWATHFCFKIPGPKFTL